MSNYSHATETENGTIALATAAEVAAGTNTEKAVVPSKLDQAKVGSFKNAKTITLGGEAAGNVSTDFSSNPTLNVTLQRASTSQVGVAELADSAETKAGLVTDRVVTPAGLNAVVPYTPTVNPSLDLDFSKQKYKYYAGAGGLTETSDMTSLITFTRSTIATYFDAMGVMKQAAVNQPRIDYDPLTGECNGLLIEEQRTNLLAYSKSIDKWVWTKAFLGAGSAPLITPYYGVAPDGTLTASRVILSLNGGTTINDYSLITQPITTTTSTTYSASIWLKTSDGTSKVVQLSFNSDSPSIFTVTGVWKRFSITASAIDASRYLRIALRGTTGTSDSADLLVWGAQQEVGAFPTSYIPSADTWTARASTATYIDSTGTMQTAASGVARSAAYDYDADGVLRPIGLLLENAATNLLTNGQGAGVATATSCPTNWTVDQMFGANIGVSAASSVTTALGYGAFRFSINGTTTAKNRLLISPTNVHPGVASATTYTFAYITRLVAGTLPTKLQPVFMWYDNAGALLSTSYGTEITPTTTETRYTTTVTSAVNAAFVRIRFDFTGYGTIGLVVNFTLDIGGLQFETGPVATSYIPTTTAQVTRAADTSTSAQVTRAADSAVIRGTNFSQWFKQYEGTVLVESVNPTTYTTDLTGIGRGLAVFNDSSDTNRIRIGNGAGVTFEIRKSSADQSSQTIGSVTTGVHKSALSFAVNNINAEIDAVSATTDSSAAIPYLTQLNIGTSTIVGGVWDGHIRSLKYYPKALSSTELQALTS